METLLSIGTVVSIGDEKNGYLPVVIAGYGGQSAEKKIYDYIGFIFPYGFISRDNIIIFDASIIHEVIHKGYEDEDYKETIPKIMESLNKLKGEK